MLNKNSQMWLLGGWLVAVVALVAWSVAIDARLSTSALLLVVGIAPAAAMLILQRSEPTQTVAEILYAVNSKTSGRS